MQISEEIAVNLGNPLEVPQFPHPLNMHRATMEITTTPPLLGLYLHLQIHVLKH